MRLCIMRAGSSLVSIALFAGCLAAAMPSYAETKAPASPPSDAECRKLVLGVWQDHYKGTRTMTIRDDGTATMLVELSGVKAALYASRLRFDMKWSITNAHLRKQTISGDPPGRVNFILKLMGDHVNEPILELSKDRLLLLDEDGKQKYDWKRVQPAAPASK